MLFDLKRTKVPGFHTFRCGGLHRFTRLVPSNCYLISIQGKNRGPPYPWAMMLWMSMLALGQGAQSLISMYLPALFEKFVSWVLTQKVYLSTQGDFWYG